MANVTLSTGAPAKIKNLGGGYNLDYMYISETVEKAIDSLNYSRLLPEGLETITIKPNLSYYWDYSTGETTDPLVVSSLIDYLRKKAPGNIQISVAEADASAMRTKYAFDVLGYKRLCRKKGVQLINLSEGKIIEKEVEVGDRRFILPMNETLLQSDLVINVPKLKYHRQHGMTCALKNMFGAISKPRKIVYHKALAHAIVGANKLVKSHLVIVDGIVALGRHPKKLGTILASDCAFAADCIAAKIMGYNPNKIAHIALARKEGLGDPTNIKLVTHGASLEQVASNFPNRNYKLQRASWKMQLSLLKGYAKLSGDTIPPVLEE